MHVPRAVDPRQQWQALQSHLRAARAALAANDRAYGLEQVDAALAIDPEFVAARALRERLEQLPSSKAATAEKKSTLTDDGHAKFEERMRLRVVDRCVDTAQAALSRRQFARAAAALDEALALAPAQPALRELAAQLSAPRQRPADRLRVRSWLAAAVVVAALVAVPSRLADSPGMPRPNRAALVSAVEVAIPNLAPLAAAVTIPDLAPSTVRAATAPLAASVDPPPPRETPRARPPFPAELRPTSSPPPAPADVSPPPPDAPSVAPAPVVQPFAPVEVAASPRPPVEASSTDTAARPVDDRARVNLTLELYRRAYERLDARLAQTVYPGVNRSALARAFEGLASQSLAFDACNVVIQGATASATCHGSSRYVPKIGSREPHFEARVWTFTLRKRDTDWTIDTARVEQ